MYSANLRIYLHDVHTGRINATMSKAHLVHSCGGTTFDELEIKILKKSQPQKLCYSRVLILSAGQTKPSLLELLHLSSSEATSMLWLDSVHLLQLQMDNMLLLLGKLV